MRLFTSLLLGLSLAGTAAADIVPYEFTGTATSKTSVFAAEATNVVTGTIFIESAGSDAIYGAADFDVTNIDVSSLAFPGLEDGSNPSMARRCGVRNLNNDGFLDYRRRFKNSADICFKWVNAKTWGVKPPGFGDRVC